MSQAVSQTGECRHCHNEHTLDDAVGAFCSTECHLRHQAEKALNIARHDHRICGTCGGFIKEVSPPSDDWEHKHGSKVQVAINNGAEYHNVDGKIALDATGCSDTRRTSVESVIGFQYRTTEAETAVKELNGPDEYSRIYQTGTGCKCGSTNHSTTDDVLRECDPARVLSNYVTTFRLLEREGQLNERINKTIFFETYRETRDFELALGSGLHE